MHGVGRSHAAITIVNALPTGVGAAAGIGLAAHAEVEIDPRPGRGEPTVSIRPRTSDTPLARATLRWAIGRIPNLGPAWVDLSVSSSIPVGVGLKSSSAVGCAILRAVETAAGRSPGPEEVARAAAEVSRRVGASATGAFDDALAGGSGGVVVTDNRHARLLRSHRLPPDLGVLLWIPPGNHPPSPDVAARFRGNGSLARRAVDAAIAGRIWEAMEANSRLVETAMGYDYGELKERLRRHGAIAAGASGLGPALATVAPADRLDELFDELPASPGLRQKVGFLSSDRPGDLG